MQIYVCNKMSSFGIASTMHIVMQIYVVNKMSLFGINAYSYANLCL